MDDPLLSYEICVKRLLKELTERGYTARNEADIYRARLLENIKQAILYGDTPTQLANRMVIIGSLNEITRGVFGKSFDEYCESDNSSSSKRASIKQTGDNQPPIQEPGFIRAVLVTAEKALEMFRGGMWEARCESIRKSFLAIDKPHLFENNSPISSSDIHLSSIIHEVDELVEHLTAFCPNCERLTRQVERESQDIQRRLNKIIEKCRTQLL